MAVTLAYEVLGEGEPLLILHGLFGSKRNWMSLAKPLSQHYRVVAADLRNHGDSGHAPDMGFKEMADDVGALCDSLKVDRINIAGHSLGGKVAMAFALEHPRRVQRLAVMDVAPVRYENDFSGYVDAMRSLPLAETASRKEAEDHLALAVPQPALRQFLLHNLARDGDRFRWRINLDGIAKNLDRLCDFPDYGRDAAFTGPALFLAGSRSDYVQPHHHARISELFPSADVVPVPDAGHWLHADQPQAVLEHLVNMSP